LSSSENHRRYDLRSIQRFNSENLPPLAGSGQVQSYRGASQWSGEEAGDFFVGHATEVFQVMNEARMAI
jgi:hypothetical protein